MDEFLQDITVYHKNGTEWARYNLVASLRNTFIKNKDNTGSSNVNSALIRIFDVNGYNNTYYIENGDVIVDRSVSDTVEKAPLTELRAIYGKNSVYSVDTVEKFIFDDLDLSHIKVGAK
jgi:hypothetical protein